MIRWLAVLAVVVVLALLMHNAPVIPVAAPEAPIEYFCGDYPKQAPAVARQTSKPQGAWHTCKASWYEYGRLTASGEIFNPEAMTCAHRQLPFGTVIEVRRGSKVIRVRVNDRGPAKWTGRDIDLSKGAFRRLALLSSGVIGVECRIGKGDEK
jgi:rare lipoprotein A (peptidoglycan hydrolase)